MLLLAMIAAMAAGAAVPADGRPNVVLILTDDQGYGDLSCHGNPVLKTPNLDRLHGESVWLVDYLGMIANIDDNVGRLRAFLEQEGLTENTIFIFTTRDGGTVGAFYACVRKL